MSDSRAPNVETQDSVTVIHLGPEYENLDESLLEELRAVIVNAADNATPPRVVLDLANTKFFGSGFIEIMFRAWKRLRSRNGDFAISGLTPYCAEVVAVTHLDRLWPVFGDRDEAVRTLGAGDEERGRSGEGETGGSGDRETRSRT